MKAAFALLADQKAHNLVRRLAWQVHSRHRTGLSVARLPPHVSLKQPFSVSDLAGLEAYMLELAAGTQPFEVLLTELQLVPVEVPNMVTGLLWVDVQENEQLRRLHEKLNRELEERFGDTAAAHDGEGYHFHMTVMLGGQPLDVYEEFFRQVPTREINYPFIVHELAMFVYDEPMTLEGEFMVYRINSLGRKD